MSTSLAASVSPHGTPAFPKKTGVGDAKLPNSDNDKEKERDDVHRIQATNRNFKEHNDEPHVLINARAGQRP